MGKRAQNYRFDHHHGSAWPESGAAAGRVRAAAAEWPGPVPTDAASDIQRLVRGGTELAAVRRQQDLRRCGAQSAAGRHSGPLPERPPGLARRAAALRRRELSVAGAGRRAGAGAAAFGAAGPDHATYRRAVESADALDANGAARLLAAAAAGGLRRARRAFPRDVLLGFVLHDARSGAERPPGSGREHGARLRLPDRHATATCRTAHAATT